MEVVVHDDVPIDIPGETKRVCAAVTELGEQVLFTEVAGDDVYLVLGSPSGIALSFHPLKSMSPYVLEGWRILLGTLDAEIIRSAANANQHAEPLLSQQVHRALWLALGVDIILQRPHGDLRRQPRWQASVSGF